MSRSSAKSSVPNTRRARPAAAMRFDLGHAACAFDQREDAARRAARPASRRSAAARLGLGQQHAACQPHVAQGRAGRRANQAEPASLIRTTMRDAVGRRCILQPCRDRVAGMRLVVGSHGVLEVEHDGSRHRWPAPCRNVPAACRARRGRCERGWQHRRAWQHLRRPWRRAAPAISRRAVAQLGQDRVRVLAQCRHRVHARARVPGAGRQHGGQRPLRRADLGPAAARLELRMRPDVLHGVDLGIGDLREFEPLDHLRAGQRLEGVHDDLAQRVALGHALEVGGEARVGGEFGLLQHLVAEAEPIRARSAGPASRWCRRRPGNGP